MRCLCKVLCWELSKSVLNKSLVADTKFLANANIMGAPTVALLYVNLTPADVYEYNLYVCMCSVLDYSLLCGFDERRKELVVGVCSVFANSLYSLIANVISSEFG